MMCDNIANTRGRTVEVVESTNSEHTIRSGSPRTSRKTKAPSAYANFRKMHFKKMMALPEYVQMTPRQRFGAVAAAIAAMWKKTSNEEKIKIRTRVRSPRKVRKVRMSKKRALKKSGSPRRARKDKGEKRTGGKLTAYNLFVKKYSAAKKTTLGTTNQRMVLKALATDWRAGIRSY